MIKNMTPEQIRQHLIALREFESWKVLSEMMINDLKQLEKDLCEADYVSIEERNRDADKAMGLRNLIEAPDHYLKLMQEGEPEEHDPYYQKRKDIVADEKKAH